MRNIVWQRVDEASAQPNTDGWNLVQVQDSAGYPEIRQAVLQKGKLPASAELHILLSAPVPAYQLLEDVHPLPSGYLSIKAVAPKTGDLLKQLLQWSASFVKELNAIAVACLHG